MTIQLLFDHFLHFLPKCSIHAPTQLSTLLQLLTSLINVAQFFCLAKLRITTHSSWPSTEETVIQQLQATLNMITLYNWRKACVTASLQHWKWESKWGFLDFSLTALSYVIHNLLVKYFVKKKGFVHPLQCVSTFKIMKNPHGPSFFSQFTTFRTAQQFSDTSHEMKLICLSSLFELKVWLQRFDLMTEKNFS